MQVKQYPTELIRVLDNNPRIIDTYKYQTLVDSLSDFPEMINIRPLIIDEDYYILCGNMRYRAMVDLQYKSIPAKMVTGLTEEQKKELIIKDNIAYGDWDEQQIEQNWDADLFNKWLGVEQFDYSTLDYADLTNDLDDKTAGVKRAIQIDFKNKYEEAKELEREARHNNIYIGGVFIQTFKYILE